MFEDIVERVYMASIRVSRLLNRHLIPTSGHKFLMLVQKDYNRQVVWLSKIKDPKSLLWFLQQGEGHNALLQILWNFAKSRWQL